MKAKMCKVLSLTLAMVLAFTLIPARELAASTNEDTSTDTVQTEEETPADSAKDDKAENPSDDKKEEPAEKADDPDEKKQDEDKDVEQDNKQPEENPDEVAETTSATPDDDKKAPEPKNANQNRGTGDDDELAFVTQPKGGTVEPQSYLKIEWETNFKPWRVEVGYFDGDQFKAVKEVTKKGDITVSYKQVPIDKEYDTDLYYSSAVTSDKWILRAYLNEGEDSPFADSARFSITKGALKFVTQPKGGTVEPQSSLNLSWETNFKPWRIEVGYFDGDQFKAVKEVTKKGDITVSYKQVPIDKEYDTDLYYSSAVTSDKWILRAYLNEGEDSPFADSKPFTIIKAVYSGTCGNNLNWSYEDGVLTIDGTGAMYNYDDTVAGSAPWHWLAANITSVELGPDVTTIGNYAFKDCKLLKTMVIKESIRQIGDYSFYKAGLQSVTISSKIMLIPTGAFAENDLRNVTIPYGIIQINSNAFASNPNLWKVTFPSSLRSIGDRVFANCRINEIVLPDGLRSIGEGAFSNNKTVWGIKFPDSVTNIGARAFADCSALQKLEFEGGAPTIGSYAFSNVTAKAYYVIGLNGWDSSTLKNYGGTITWVGLQTCSEDGKLTWSLKDGVLTISGTGYMTQYLSGNKPGWYEDRDKIKSIIIMPGVARIGSHAFDDCTNVNTIIFYGSKPSFGFTPFTGVTANAYYTPDETWTDLPNYSDASITWIESNGQCGDNLFWRIDENKILHITGTGDMYDYPGNFSLPWYKWADDIVGVEIASGCTSIGEGAFYSCSKIESVTMPSTVKTIGKNAFYRCSRLSSINLSSALTTIGESAFYYCYALSEVTIPDKVTVIDETAFMGCSSLKSVVIPDSVVTLGFRAFAQCSSLEYVEIGKGVTVIPGSAFSSCKNLASVEFSGDVTAIYNYAFMGCSSLDYIELPATLKEMGMFAFSNCTSLSRIKIHDKLESLDYGVFSGCSALSEAFFYGTPEQWDAVTKGSSNTALINIVRCVRAEGDCSKNDSTEYSDVMWRLFWDGELVIDGYGEMASYSNGKDTKAPWLRLEAGSDITKVVISDGVTSVGRYAFLNCSNITSVELPDTLAKIEENAFYGCSSISEISIPENVIIIQNYAFYKCSSISSIRIPGGVTVIYASAFANCSALENVEIADGVRTIKGSAFYGCTSLVEINLPSSVTSIEMYAFSDCTHLVSIDLGGNVEFIGAGAFENCTKLAAITIPASVTTMQYRTFRNCSDLKTVIFEGNAIELSEYATPFVNVNTYAYYPADNSTWTESARQMYGETIKWVPYGEGDIIVKFSHSCSFSNNLSVNFYIPADEVSDYENFRLVVKKQVFNGSSYTWKETTLTDYTTSVQSGVTYLRFVYAGVAAKEMGDELEATLYMDRYGMTFNTTVDSYSVKEYAYNRLKYSDDDIFKTLLVDMLNYGAASQTYFKYNTGHLVTAELTSAQRALASEMPELKSVEDYMPVFTADEPSAYFYGKSVVMGNNVELKYYMRFDSGAPADSVVLHVEYKTVSGTLVIKNFHASEFVYDAKYDAYTIKISDISAKDMCRSIDAALYDGEYSNDNDDNRISELMTYSIESYVYNRLQKSTDEDFKALVKALIKYGKSAENYFKTH